MTLREWVESILVGLILSGVVVLVVEVFIKHRFG